MGNYVYRAEFTNKSGVTESFVIEAEGAKEMTEGRTALLAAIADDVPGPRFNVPPQTAGKPEPMVAAAVASGFAAPQCPAGHGTMRHVVQGVSSKVMLPPDENGVVRGKPYPAFDICDTCGKKANSPK